MGMVRPPNPKATYDASSFPIAELETPEGV